MCWNQEPGCWSGPVVPSVGTVISCCHLVGSYAAPAFHPAAVALLRPRLEAARCVDAVCDASGRCVHRPIADGTPCGTECAPRSCRSAACTPDAPVPGLAALGCTLEAFAAAGDGAFWTHAVGRRARADMKRAVATGRHRLRARCAPRTAGSRDPSGGRCAAWASCSILSAAWSTATSSGGAMSGDVVARLRAILGTAHAPLAALQASLTP
ncbi:MAG TPA: hypothetical protein VFD84_19485 [Candidatus Binatia bacterium]|nr:hypothetical protein [Candidatus Binatia bacterium]